MGARKCIHCHEFARDKSNKNSIGICGKYGKYVIDALCGCEDQENKTILWNFQEKTTPEVTRVERITG